MDLLADTESPAAKGFCGIVRSLVLANGVSVA